MDVRNTPRFETMDTTTKRVFYFGIRDRSPRSQEEKRPVGCPRHLLLLDKSPAHHCVLENI